MIFASLLLLYSVGVYLLFAGQRKANAAFQDEAGFHKVWINNSAKAKDTCVIWRS